MMARKEASKVPQYAFEKFTVISLGQSSELLFIAQIAYKLDEVYLKFTQFVEQSLALIVLFVERSTCWARGLDKIKQSNQTPGKFSILLQSQLIDDKSE